MCSRNLNFIPRRSEVFHIQISGIKKRCDVGICRCSAITLKSGKDGQFEKEGYGQVRSDSLTILLQALKAVLFKGFSRVITNLLNDKN